MSYERPGFDPTETSMPAPEGVHIDHLRMQNLGVHIIDAARIIERSQDSAITLTDNAFGPTGPAAFMRSVVSTRIGNARLYRGAIVFDHAATLDIESDQEPLFDDIAVQPFGTVPGNRLLHGTTGDFYTSMVPRPDSHAITFSNEISIADASNPALLTSLVAPHNDYVKHPIDQLHHFINSMVAGAYMASDIYDPGRQSLDMDELVITPDGPLIRDPQSGEYRHLSRRTPVSLLRTTKPYRLNPSYLGEAAPPPGSAPSGPPSSRAVSRRGSRPLFAEAPAQEPVALTVPVERFEDLYAIDDIKAALDPIIQFYRHPEVFKQWKVDRPPSGVLLQGPPGTGKTTIIKAMANAIDAKLRVVTSADIYDRYYGCSESNLMEIFDSVRSATEPVVLLFDELDSIVANADASGFTYRSVAGVFKSQTNDIAESNPNVIIAATTNAPDAIDEALIRSGRFDLKLTVARATTETRRSLLIDMIIAADTEGVAPTMFTDESMDGFSSLFAEDVLADTKALDRLVAASHDFTPADVHMLLRRVKLQKATAQLRGGAAGPITLADLESTVAAMRRGV